MRHPIFHASLLTSLFGLILLALLAGSPLAAAGEKSVAQKRLLYVAVPGIRDYLEYGGHGILIFDIEDGHKFVKRLPSSGLDEHGHPLNVKGICASSETQRLYISTTRTLSCFDLLTSKLLWEKPYEGGCDRMAISPDGKVIYLPSLEQEHWNVVDGLTGGVIKKIVTHSGSHNTVIGRDGRFAYLAGLKSPLLRVADTSTHEVIREIGPFGNVIRPFTINGKQTRCYVNVNELLGFEVGDLQSGKVLYRVEVQGFKPGPTKRHGCPSHGIALTPDERELWLTDAANSRLHIFDNTVMPPKQTGVITLRDQPGWISFGIDGRLAYSSTGEVIQVNTRKIVAALKDETGAAVQSEKLLEIDFEGGRAMVAGNQFGLGNVTR
jgi:hypothetical protein